MDSESTFKASLFSPLPHNCVRQIIQLSLTNTWASLIAVGKESACNAGDLDSIPGMERAPGEGKGYPLQYSGLDNSMDCIVHGVTKDIRT